MKHIRSLLWTLYEAHQVFAFDSTLNPIPCILLATASSIQTFSQLIMIRNAVKDDEDSFETSPLLKIIVWICVVVGVIVTIGAAVVIMGVKL
jgi:nitric oxide reductase large subunit